MIKPNVRGVSKRSLRFTGAGWRNSEDDSLIQHRYPWRRNWVEKLAKDTSLRPLLSRSGNVYLAYQIAMAKDLKSRAGTKSRLVIFSGAVAILTLLTVPLFEVQSQSQKPVSTQASAPVDCESMLNHPEKGFLAWLQGKSNIRFTISETQRAMIGGVELRRVQVNCDHLQSIFSLTMTFRNGEWKLKKFARLDN